ncbi:transketolase [Arthrobacter crusticola]|uniref:Transketolase n=1 Tax=Arthrobacter crusticola TaxID=2547960 RepID=A0A4R5U3N7_9MICC|nr:transketolase [Arthrobacter crusticola]TDK28233.1 transketolase [Arthrobacter crusticola]
MLTADVSQAAEWRSLRKDLLKGDASFRAEKLHERAQATRRSILDMISTAGQGHIGGDFSVTDILTVLFDAVLDVDPEDPRKDGRDHFVLSKGHCAAALYSTLAHCGFFSADELRTFMEPMSALNGHPNRVKVPGVETNTGPLGHGLPVAVGAAIGARLRGNNSNVYVVLGDGEMQEGSNWEALMSASHQKLENLHVIVDRNRLQQGAGTEDTNGLDPLDARLAAFGLEVRIVDGHDYNALLEAMAPSTTGSPVAVIANTIKGKGVSFIEDRVEWHHKVPSKEQTTQAFQELS